MPAARLHPWFLEQALSARNRVRFARERWSETLGLAAAWVLILGLLAYLWTFLEGDWPGLLLQNLVRLPALALLLFGVTAFALTRYFALWLCRELRYGWWGASPIPDQSRRAAARWLALAMALGLWLALALLLSAIAWQAIYWRRWYVPLLELSALGIPLGAGLGLWSALRRAAHVDETRARTHPHGKPLIPIHLLERGALAEVATWQRLETVAHWRAGGAAWALAFVGVLVPAGTAWTSLVGLILLSITLIWFAIALKSSTFVTGAFAELTAPMPLSFAAFARATARFPLLATLWAALSGALALWAQGAPRGFVPGYAGAVLALAAFQFALALRYRRTPGRAWLRLAFDALLMTGAALIQPWLPALLYPLLLARHLWRARSAR
jgi:hypothetical protein